MVTIYWITISPLFLLAILRFELTLFFPQEIEGKEVENSKKLTATKQKVNFPKRSYRREAPEFRRPKGKTYRAAHYGPRNYDDQRVQEIIKKKKMNDSKPGGRSWTQGKLKTQKVLGSERLNPPNMARVWNINCNEETPDQDLDQMWGV